METTYIVIGLFVIAIVLMVNYPSKITISSDKKNQSESKMNEHLVNVMPPNKPIIEGMSSGAGIGILVGIVGCVILIILLSASMGFYLERKEQKK